MKKTFTLVIIVILLTLCLFTPVLCKGELGDMDAFSTYIGKTRSEVRRIAPMFDEFSDTMYIVDYIEEGDDFLALVVMFDEYNLVQSVMVWVTKGALEIIGIEDSIDMVAAFGAYNLGFPSDGVIRSEKNDDGDFIMNIKGGINIITTQMSDESYAVMSVQK